MKPAHTDWFCTDEDGVENDGVNNSAECTENDATADPFSWYESRLAAAINYLVNRGDKDGPTWTVDNMAREIGIAVNGIGYYATSAPATASTWVNFYTKADRPKDPAAIKAYVVTRLKAQICDPSLATEAALKATPQDQAKTMDNITALRAESRRSSSRRISPKTTLLPCWRALMGGGTDTPPPAGITADDLKCN